jgi:hypothetical protein
MLLVRVTVGKIKDKDRLQSILRRIPMRPEVPGWNCVGWVQEAINAILQDGKALGTCAESWTAIRDTAMQYVADKKAAHRFDGRVQHDMKKAATWDMLGGKEAIP